jgi:hypothetical protein
MYPVLALAGLTAFLWGVAIWTSFADDEPAPFRSSSSVDDRAAA